MNYCLYRVFTLSIIYFALLLASATTGLAQEAVTDGSTPLGLSPGAPAGSYALSDFENVNLFNGSLNFALPIAKVGGRGGAGYAITLRIDQKWLVHKEPYDGQPPINYYYPSANWWSENALKRTYGVGSLSIRQGGSRNFVIRGGCGYVHDSTLTRLTFTAPDGTEYELRDQLTNGKPDQPVCTGFNRGKIFITADGSAATFVSDIDIVDYPFDNPADIPGSGDMMLKDGTRFRIQDGKVMWMRDRNGNRTSFTHDAFGRLTTIKDSLNREVTVAYGASPPAYDQITMKGFGGAQRIIKIHLSRTHSSLRSDYAAMTETQLFPELNGAAGTGSGNPEVVSAIELPSGKQYQFLYNSYSELARVVLPTGGAIEYDWTAGLTDSVSGSGVFNTYPAEKVIYRRVIERRVYPDGGTGSAFSSRMTYSRPESSSTNAGYVIADQYDSTGALLTREHHYFHGSARASFWLQPTQYSPWQDGKEYLTKTFAENGTTLLRQVAHTFAQRAAVSWWTGDPALAPPNDTRIVETVSTLSDANLVSKQVFGYDDTVPFNNQNSVKEYHFGTGVSGALARETKTTFVTSATYTGTAVHLRSLPSQVSVYEGATERARTTFEYDNYAAAPPNHATLTSRSTISGLDSAFTTGYSTRGNVTATTRYLLTNGAVTGSISTYSHFDVAGNVVKAIDALGYATTLYYDDVFGAPDGNARLDSAPFELSSVNQESFGFVTRTQNHLNHNSYAQFDYYTGKPVDGEDPNGIVASGYYNDSLDRPTQVVRAVGASIANQTTYAYDDTNRIITTTSDFDSLNDPTPLKSQTLYDGMGRTKETRQYEGGTNYIAVQIQYDALGRAFKTSNPFRPWQSETAIWTTSGFDALGRVVSVTTPDSAMVATSYSGNTVTVTDQAGKKRKSVTDALGRLTQVYEDPTGLNYLTSYAYDVLDNLTTVTQGTQTRTFTYDSLKRLKSAVNPESGTINYTYDNNSNLLTKVDARSITTTYVYDALNRNTTVNYSDTTINPDITRTYDGAANGNGRLWNSYAGGTETAGTTVEHVKIQSYDALGRPLDQRQRFKTTGVWSAEYQTQRTYNRAGSVLTQTYPSGRTVTYAYDAAGRSSSFTGNLGDGTNRNYATSIVYSSFGGMTREQFGTTTPLYHKQQYNIRGQLYDMKLSTVNDSVNWNRGAIVNYYSFQPYGFGTSGPDNNSNLLVQQHWVPDNDAMSTSSFMQQNYGYDALNRINWIGEYQDGATATGSQNFAYDRWGNRTISAASGTGINNKAFTVNAANNRLGVPGGQSGTMTYDAAGNLTTDTYGASAVTRVYDADNRMTSETQGGGLVAGTYTYNADGQRVRRRVNGVETWQVYGMEGELLAEYALSGSVTSPQKEYGYRNGELLVTAEPSTHTVQNVTWTGAAGVTVNGNSLTKTAATGWNNAGAASTQTIASGDGYVEFTATETNTNRMCGLSFGNSNHNYTDIDFAMYPTSNGTVAVYEGGVSRGNFGTYTPGTVFRVAVESGVVKYHRNGAVFYTSAVVPTYPLLADTALYTVGATLTNVVIASGGSNSQVNWLVSDHLGTPRIIADKTGSLAGIKRHDYLPFGEELLAGTGGRTPGKGYSGDNVRQKFTQKERDNETGLDFFEARYYASTQGRFTSPDEFTGGPEELYYFADDASANPTFYSDLRKPQSLNKYQYAYNNPLRWIDPDGHEPDDPQKKKKEDIDVVVIKTVDPKIVSFDTKLIDKVPNTGEVPVGGEFEIKYKYVINEPTDGSKPEDAGSIGPITPKGTFTESNQVGLVSSTVKVDKEKEAVAVEKTERYVVNERRESKPGATAAINFKVVVKDPNTGKVVERRSTEGRGDKYIPVRNVPKEPRKNRN